MPNCMTLEIVFDNAIPPFDKNGGKTKQPIIFIIMEKKEASVGVIVSFME